MPAKAAPYLSVHLGTIRSDLTPLVTSASVEDNDRLVDEARLTFKDPDADAFALLVPNAPIVIELGWKTEHAVLFEGTLVEVKPEASADGTRTVTAVARDLSHAMSQTPVTLDYKPNTLSNIIKEIATRNGWTDDKAVIQCDPNPPLTERGDLRQVNKTDYAYLQLLADRWGGRAFVEYSDGASRLYWISNRKLLEAAPLGRLKYCRGTEKLIEFKYEAVAARAARQIVATAVDPLTGKAKTTNGPMPEPPPAGEGPEPPPAGETESGEPPEPSPVGEPPLPSVKVIGLASDTAAAAQVTIFDPTRSLGLRGTGRAVGTVMLRAKGKVEIVGIPARVEGAWYIEQATHTWSVGSTGEVRRASYETTFTATR